MKFKTNADNRLLFIGILGIVLIGIIYLAIHGTRC